MTDINKSVKTTNYTCKGNCSGCGNCCGDILHLSKNEIKKIAKYVKQNKIEATSRNILIAYDNTCPFRDNKDKKCKIYEIRPEICRVYKCDKTPEEVYRNREFNNERKLPRSMRSLFYNDNSGAKWLFENFGKLIYDKNDKAIGGKNDKKRNISKNEKS